MVKTALCLCAILPSNPILIMRKAPDNSKLRGMLQNTCPVLRKPVGVIRNKEILRNHTNNRILRKYDY